MRNRDLSVELSRIEAQRRRYQATDNKIGEAARTMLKGVNQDIEATSPLVFSDVEAARRYERLIDERARLLGGGSGVTTG